MGEVAATQATPSRRRRTTWLVITLIVLIVALAAALVIIFVHQADARRKEAAPKTASAIAADLGCFTMRGTGPAPLAVLPTVKYPTTAGSVTCTIAGKDIVVAVFVSSQATASLRAGLQTGTASQPGQVQIAEFDSDSSAWVVFPATGIGKLPDEVLRSAEGMGAKLYTF